MCVVLQVNLIWACIQNKLAHTYAHYLYLLLIQFCKIFRVQWPQSKTELHKNPIYENGRDFSYRRIVQGELNFFLGSYFSFTGRPKSALKSNNSLMVLNAKKKCYLLLIIQDVFIFPDRNK